MSQTKKTKSASKSKTPPPVKTEQVQDAPMLGGNDRVLGTLSAEDNPKPSDTPKAPKSSMRKKDTSAKTEAPAPTDTPAPDNTPPTPGETPSSPGVLDAEPPPPEPLRLPRGGFIAYRKSGGLKFSTREVVVYPDGRVAYDARGVSSKDYNNLRRVLNDGQVLSLRKLLDQTNFWRTESGGKQNPDAYAYEIAARVGQRSNEIEVFDGSVPENIQPLLERLNKLLPE